MSDRYGNQPDEEFVIGASSPPPPGNRYAPAAEPSGSDWDDSEDGGYDDEDQYDDDGEYAEFDEEPWYDEYEDSAPVRQPMFYVFVALAALVGGIVVFLLFSLVNNDDDAGSNGGDGGDAKLQVQVDSPPRDRRINLGATEDVIVQATASESITRFELFAGDRSVDSIEITETPSDNKYRAVLKLVLNQKGTYEIFVRATTSSGATKDSAKVRVIAVEPVGEKPQTIKGRVVADTTLRSGPGEDFADVGTLKAGEEVTILGKSRSLEWLLVEAGGQAGRWARRSAIDPLDTLDLVPTRDVTPTPGPTATNTAEPSPSPSPSPSASPSPGANAPDFVPTNAVLINGGKTLKVTVSNTSNAAYSGPVVVAVGGGDVPVQEQVIDAKLAASGGAAVVEFAVNPAITETGKKAVITVDPKDAVRELREDNNVATFVLLPAAESPQIVIQSTEVKPGSIVVIIKNTGGALSATSVEVRVTLGSASASNSSTVALAKDQVAPAIEVARPAGTGTARVDVLIGGQVQATAEVDLPASPTPNP